MQSAFIVHSPSTKYYAELLAPKWRNPELYEVTKSPDESIVNLRHGKDVTIAIGGGSVIDTAKIFSGNKLCYAVPTTASGAAMTSHAAVWGERKTSVRTVKPILKRNYYGMTKRLSDDVKTATMYDCLSHAYESLWSKNATDRSKRHATKAIKLVELYNERHDMNDLIDAGNEAGKAIEITGTNVIHALSYPLTLGGMPHGEACGMVMNKIARYMIGELIVNRQWNDKIEEHIIDKALEYPQIHTANKPITKEILEKIL